VTTAAKYLKLNLWFFLIGIAVSGYLVWHHYELINGDAGFGSFCSISTTVDCDAVNSSIYSELFGIPLATWGLSYYLFAFILSFTGWRNAFARREAALFLFPFTLLSAVAGVATLGITLVVLKKFCIMCSTMQFVQLITAVFTWLAVRDVTTQSTLKHEMGEMRRNRIVTFTIVGLVCLGLTHLVSSQFKKKIPFDHGSFVTAVREQPVFTVEAFDSPRMGYMGEGAELQLIEFADFQCPACAMAARHMHRLLKIYGDRVQVIFKNFPLDSACNPHLTRRLHMNACEAAKAGYCAHKQGHFEAMYEKLFGNQHEISTASIASWATEIGLNREQFETCLSSPDTTTALQRDMDQAKSAGLESTPTFFVNGRKVEGPIDEQRLKALLQEFGKTSSSNAK
jgi:protein-disulfide isomerase/uncharacterized membrane protein